jgi:hypothetical protein
MVIKVSFKVRNKINIYPVLNKNVILVNFFKKINYPYQLI